MSNRSLLEFNHDLRLPTTHAEAEGLGWEIHNFLASGDPKDLPAGVTHLQTRHHSDPAPAGWVPPQDRQTGYRCLGWTIGTWHFVVWDERRRHWHIPGIQLRASRANQPTAFLPMPQAPGERA